MLLALGSRRGDSRDSTVLPRLLLLPLLWMLDIYCQANPAVAMEDNHSQSTRIFLRHRCGLNWHSTGTQLALNWHSIPLVRAFVLQVGVFRRGKFVKGRQVGTQPAVELVSDGGDLRAAR